MTKPIEPWKIIVANMLLQKQGIRAACDAVSIAFGITEKQVFDFHSEYIMNGKKINGKTIEEINKEMNDGKEVTFLKEEKEQTSKPKEKNVVVQTVQPLPKSPVTKPATTKEISKKISDLLSELAKDNKNIGFLTGVLFFIGSQAKESKMSELHKDLTNFIKERI